MNLMNQTESTAPSTAPTRRGFLKQASAAILGAIAGIVPLISGLIVFLDPLRRKAEASEFLSVASLNALPEDGSPRKFSVVASRTDAWNRSPQTPIGAVYLRRAGGKVQALNVVCPHAGCFVDYNADAKGYHCPCHDSTFALSGEISSPSSPAPRGLDELDVEVRNESEVWVKFQNFQAGQAKKTPA
jgi:menaquinol-cytochrome c reductase iron-sulfur subunit